MVTEVLFRNLY